MWRRRGGSIWQCGRFPFLRDRKVPFVRGHSHLRWRAAEVDHHLLVGCCHQVVRWSGNVPEWNIFFSSGTKQKHWEKIFFARRQTNSWFPLRRRLRWIPQSIQSSDYFRLSQTGGFEKWKGNFWKLFREEFSAVVLGKPIGVDGHISRWPNSA